MQRNSSMSNLEYILPPVTPASEARMSTQNSTYSSVFMESADVDLGENLEEDRPLPLRLRTSVSTDVSYRWDFFNSILVARNI